MISRNGNRIEVCGGYIAGVVTVVPSLRLTNGDWPHAQEAAKMTGVLERRHAGDGNTTESLCLAAAKKLLSSLSWTPESIDALVYVTQTPGSAVPASAFTLHAQLGLPQNCPAVEVNWSCSGYVYGLWIASKLALGEVGENKRVLLLVGDTSSKIIDPEDRATAPLFGDAGSATAVQGGDGLMRFVLGTDGSGADQLSQAHGDFLHMDGPQVFGFTLKRVPGLVADVLEDRSLSSINSIDYLLFHQANKWMLDHIAKKCGLGVHFMPEQIPSNIDRFGNTSCTSIPLLLCDKVGFDPGVVAMLGYGAGWGWAAVTVDLWHMRVCELMEV